MLEGKPMGFNLANLRDRVQSFYTFFRDTLQFSLPGSKCDQYKMMVMVMYSLDGTAYGGTYDNFIGALWVAAWPTNSVIPSSSRYLPTRWAMPGAAAVSSR